MRNGMLAQWQGRIAGRGMAAAALLTIPVLMAGVIGFNGGLDGVTGGFFSALDGPEPQASESIAAPGAGAPAAGAPGGAGGGAGGGDDGGGSADPGGGGGAPSPGPATPTGDAPGTPGLPVPVDDPSGTVDGVVNGINQTVNGLTGNR